LLKDYQIILEQSAFDGKRVSITTKDRGIIKGAFTGVDEFDTDPERYGFYISIKPHFYDTVFLDEIVDITEHSPAPRITFSRRKLKYVSGK